jgi:hypothetical protein
MLVIFLSPHLRAPACPFTPKVLRAREHTPTLSPSIVFTFGFTLSPSRSLRVRQLGDVLQLGYINDYVVIQKSSKTCYWNI